MENNSLTPSPLPTPGPGNSMPDFVSAPAPAPVVPTVSTMPAFGQQPVMPMPPVSPAPMPQPVSPQPVPAQQPMTAIPAQPAAQPTQPAVQPVQPAEQSVMPVEAPASDLGEIKEETPTQNIPTQSYSRPTPFVEAMSTTPTVGATMPEPIPEKKKINVKLFAIIGAAAFVLIGGIVAAVLLLNQPKPTSEPTDAPQPELVTIDTSIDFDKLTAEDAEVFLSATEAYQTFFPDDYAPDAVDYLGTSNLGIFYSYEKKEDILKIAKESSYVEKFKDKITEDNTVIDYKDGYAFVSFSPEETECGNDCLAIIFDKKVVNFYSEPYLDVLTGVTSQVVHIMFTSYKESGRKYMPLVAAVFMNGEKVYSSKVTTEQNGEMTFVVNSLSGSMARKITKKTTHFKIISTGEFLYLPNETVETML